LITIRKFQPYDFPAVIDIERMVFNEHDPYFYMQFYETCSDGFLVAEFNRLLAGYIVGFRSSEDTGRIFSFAVHPSFQNRGIGSALLKELTRIFSEEGISKVALEVRTGNIRARRFYERHGFHRIGIAKNYYNDGECAILMKLELMPYEFPD
jgi:ribosomal-protein-alanine N-acetyltransferase